MRVLPVAIALSAALHGGAIAWVHTHPHQDSEPRPPVTLAPVEIVPAPAEPEPMIVALLPDHSVVATAPIASRDGDTRAEPAKLASSTGVRTETHATTTLPPAAESGTRRHALMTMRQPERPKLDGATLSGDFLDNFLRNSRPLAPKEIRTEQLQDELAAATGRLKNSRWVRNATPEQLAGARFEAIALRDELANRELKPDGTGMKAEHETFNVRVAADGSARIEDKANIQRKSLLNWEFDATDALMRRNGIDPYSSYKLKVLDETRDERVAIGKRHRSRELARSRQYVRKHLERLWATTPDPVARKRGLFELWDDCAETGNEELVAAGTQARAYVVGFIRSKLPPGTAHAFTADELARFNRQRRSRIAFAPY